MMIWKVICIMFIVSLVIGTLWIVGMIVYTLTWIHRHPDDGPRYVPYQDYGED